MLFEKGSGISFERVCYMCPKCNQGYFFNNNENFSTICPKCNIEMVCVEKKFVTLEQEEKRKRDYERIVNGTFHVPKCPTCQSANIRKIGSVERGASIWAFGLFSKKINKTFKCNSCGYTW